MLKLLKEMQGNPAAGLVLLAGALLLLMAYGGVMYVWGCVEEQREKQAEKSTGEAPTVL
jgi:hypothetical protein